MEVHDNRQNNENPFVQHKCQVCIAIRSRNLANEQDHAEKEPDFCKSVLAENIGNTVDGQSQQQGPLGEDGDGLGKHQHYETGLDVEPPGQAKEGDTEKHLAA